VFARIKAIQAEQAARNQDWNTATNMLKEIMEFGRKVQTFGASSIICYKGQGIRSRGFECARRLAALSCVSPEELQDMAALLDIYQPDERFFQDIVKQQYQFSKQLLYDAGSGNLNTEASKFERGIMKFGWRIIFNYEKSVGVLAEEYRNLSEAFAKHRSEYNVNPAMQIVHQRSVLEHVLSKNSLGEVFLSMDVGSVELTMKHKCIEKSRFAATQIILALRRYQLESGALPQTLDALVPNYLPQVPGDDFDGQPFRYLAEKKLLYSVGENLQDDGGVARDAQKNRLDYIYPIHF
jgi:hypothetical protein